MNIEHPDSDGVGVTRIKHQFMLPRHFIVNMTTLFNISGHYNHIKTNHWQCFSTNLGCENYARVSGLSLGICIYLCIIVCSHEINRIKRVLLGLSGGRDPMFIPLWNSCVFMLSQQGFLERCPFNSFVHTAYLATEELQ